MKRNWLFMLGLLAGLLAGCTLGASPPSGGAPTSGVQQPAESTSVPTEGGGKTTEGQVYVEQVEIVMLESFPVQVNAIVRGNLTDACTTLSGTEVNRQDNLFLITLQAARPADAVCAAVLTPFEQTVPLDVVGLPAGTYMVDANGVQRAFTLSVDNVSPTDGTQATPTAVTLSSPTPEASPTPTTTFTPTPTPTTAEGACTNRINFVGENVPDDSSFAVGTTFEKTWTLENAGSCTWTEKYAAVFVDGDRMGATSPVPLPKSVAPGQKLTLRVTFTTPDQPGTYRSVWRLQDEKGVQFGPGKQGDGQFWVQIVATESSSNLELGEPTWVDPMDNATHWYLVETENTTFAIKDGALQMTAKTPGAADEWGLAQYNVADDLYLEVDFKTGDTCSGLDRYGVIVRAPKPDRGYVFGFSCDGRFRLYQWDGDSYTGLQEWKAHPAIRTGPGVMNTLGIWVKGKQFKLYANGQLLATAEDATFDNGQFGLFIASADTPKFKVRVEETRYWALK